MREVKAGFVVGRITRRVPVPASKKNDGLADTLKRMKVGESFVVETDCPGEVNAFDLNLRERLYYWKKKLDIELRTEVVGYARRNKAPHWKDPSMMRVWRVA